MIQYKSVEVEVDLDDFDDDDLIEEIESRGYELANGIDDSVMAAIRELHQAYTTGKYYEHILGKLFDQALGRIV